MLIFTILDLVNLSQVGEEFVPDPCRQFFYIFFTEVSQIGEEFIPGCRISHYSCEQSVTVKLFHIKATIVSKICDGIESLISNSKPLLSLVILPLNIYSETGSSEIITDFQRLDRGLPYTETTFIEDNGSNGAKNKPSLYQTTSEWCS